MKKIWIRGTNTRLDGTVIAVDTRVPYLMCKRPEGLLFELTLHPTGDVEWVNDDPIEVWSPDPEILPNADL